MRSFPGPYFPVFSPNTGKYGSEKTTYLDNIYAVRDHGNRISKLVTTNRRKHIINSTTRKNIQNSKRNYK